MTRRTTYRVAGESLLVEAVDAGAAHAIDALFDRWYLTPDLQVSDIRSRPAIVVSSEGRPAPIPSGLQPFEVAGGGTCYTDGQASYIDLNGSVVAIGAPDRPAVEVWFDPALPLDGPVLTRVITYALSSALRRQRRFELHSGALIDPANGRGVLIIGPSGSGKSTLTVHLASAGWPFLTDDVLLLGEEAGGVNAWALRRFFSVTSETFASSRDLQARTSPGQLEIDIDGKQHFLPRSVFAAEFKDRCVPGTLLFPELTGAARTRVSRLSTADVMARLIRMNPWSCYDRPTAGDHLAVLSALARQCVGYSLLAGRDLLDLDTCVTMIAACVREELVA